ALCEAAGELTGEAGRPLLAGDAWCSGKPSGPERGRSGRGGLPVPERQARALPRLLLPDPHRPGRSSPGRYGQLPRQREALWRLRSGRLARTLRRLGDHDLSRQPRRRRVPEGPRPRHDGQGEGDEDLRSRRQLGQVPTLEGRRAPRQEGRFPAHDSMSCRAEEGTVALARKAHRPRRSAALFIGVTLALAAGLALPVAAQDVLPRPAPPFKGKIGRTAKDSVPDFPKGIEAPKGAPNVLLILTDDVGFGASSTFGGPIQTPNFQRVADSGLRYNMFHTTALCSPTRPP